MDSTKLQGDPEHPLGGPSRSFFGAGGRGLIARAYADRSLWSRLSNRCQSLYFILAAYLLYTSLFFGLVNQVDADVGRDFLVADLMLHGRVLYRDVNYTFGPFAPWLHAGLFRAFGISTTVILAAGAVAGAGIVLLTYLVARQILSPGASTVASLVVLETAVYGPHYMSYAVPYTFAATYGLLFSLLTLYAASRSLEQGFSPWDIAAGGAAALAIANKLEFGFISAGVVLLSLALRVRARRRGLWSAALACAAVYGLVIAAFLAPVLRSVSWNEFLACIYPRQAIQAWEYFYQTMQYRGPNLWAGIWLSTTGFLLNLGFILSAACWMALSISFLRGERPSRRLVLIVAAAGLPFLWKHRYLGYYPLLMHGMVLGFAIAGRIRALQLRVVFLTCGAAIFLIRVWPAPMIDRSLYTLLYFIPSLVVYLYLCYEVAAPWLGRLFPGVSMSLALTTVFVGCFVVYPLARSTYPWLRHSEWFSTDRGPIRVTQPHNAKTALILDEIRRRTSPGDKILVLPYAIMYYFLTARQPASKWMDYIPGHLQGETEREEIRRLSETPPRLVIIDDAPQPHYYPGPANKFGEAYDVQLGQWIWQNYARIREFPFAGRSIYVLVPGRTRSQEAR